MTKELFLYSKSNCSLCDKLKTELDNLNLSYHVIMIDDDAELLHRYGARVPVLEAGNKLVCEGHYDQETVAMYLNIT
jgi:glutaredoxin